MKIKSEIMCVGIVVMFLLTAFTSSIVADSDEGKDDNNLNLSYNFDKPFVSKVEKNNEIYDQVSMNGCSMFNVPNKPQLPMFGTNILIPDGTKIKNIEVTCKKISLEGKYNIILGSEPVPLSKINTGSSSSNVEKQVFISSSLYPENLYEKVCVQRYHGYEILVLSLHPIQYLQSTGEIFYYEEINVNIELIEEGGQSEIAVRNSDSIELSQMVFNPEIVDTYSNNIGLLSATSDGSKMVIITSEDLVSDFESLADYHTNNGVTTFFKTVEEIKENPDFRLDGKWGDLNPDNPFVTENIDSEYLFDDLQAWIRNYIRYAYQEQGIEYVLLGGDTSIIPEKKLPIETSSGSIYYVPTDLYYGGLDNSFYLEEEYQEDIYMDFMPEVAVGRACVETSIEVNNFVDKTLTYMNSGNDPYLNKVLNVGEYLGFLDWGLDDGVDYGGNWLDQLIDVCIDDYSYGPDKWYIYRTLTSGIPSSQYEIDKLYDRDVNNFNPAIPELTGWKKSDILDKLNSNYHIVIHDGHGNEFHNMKLDHPFNMKGGVVGLPSNDLDGLKNTKPFFVYSSACNSGAFDDYEVLGKSYDCIAEYMTVKSSSGAFAGLWNSRSGWGAKDLHLGPSQWYLREFWDAIFYEEITSIGKANDDSKIDNLDVVDCDTFRMIHVGLNLFGDPAVNLHVDLDNSLPDVPETPEINDQNTAYAYAPCSFSTRSTDTDSDKLYYGWDWNNNGKIGYKEWTGPYEPGEEAVASHIFEEPGQYTIKVCAMDKKLNPTDFSDTFSFEILPNQRPEIPKKPSGENKYKPNTPYEYTSSATDPDGDKLFYQFYFDYIEYLSPMDIPIRWKLGDGEWLGPFEPGENATATHIWSNEIYTRDKLEIDPQTGWPTRVVVTVSVHVKDEHGAECKEISDSLYLSPKKTRSKNKEILPILPNFPDDILNRFPILSEIIKSLLLDIS